MIDLHTHTDESDGSFSPAELVTAAVEKKLEALAITDHDTFAGYLQAVPCAARLGLDLVCGIELSTTFRGRSVHLLGYFVKGEPSHEFQKWVLRLQESRILRNRELIERMQALGLDVTLEEVSSKARRLVGRPHFAAVLVEKGYAPSVQEAFDKFLSESGACFVPRDEPHFEDAVQRIRAAGGIPSLPHPGRISGDLRVCEKYASEMRDLGLQAIEVHHSDHSADAVNNYMSLAARLSLAITGGSDFHGAMKPRVSLGTGIDGNVSVPASVLAELRRNG